MFFDSCIIRALVLLPQAAPPKKCSSKNMLTHSIPWLKTWFPSSPCCHNLGINLILLGDPNGDTIQEKCSINPCFLCCLIPVISPLYKHYECSLQALLWKSGTLKFDGWIMFIHFPNRQAWGFSIPWRSKSLNFHPHFSDRPVSTWGSSSSCTWICDHSLGLIAQLNE